MNTIQRLWESFVSIPAYQNLTPNELHTIREIFYCGAMAMLSAQTGIMRCETHSEQARRLMLDGLADEITAFSNERSAELKANAKPEEKEKQCQPH